MVITKEEEQLRALRRERVARVKRLMRWLPRRANLHRYPFLRWFAASARKRIYLWSFRSSAAVPAIYVGCVLAFLPLYGLQIPLALLFAFVIRANLPILVGLQAITNPLTFLPVYFSAFAIGRIFLQLFGIDCPHLNLTEFRVLFDNTVNLELRHSIGYVAQVFGITFVGGTMMGLSTAAVAGMIYRIGAREVAATYRQMQELQRRREETHRASREREQRPKRRFPKSRRLQTP